MEDFQERSEVRHWSCFSEAAVRTIALLRDGDMISIDIPGRRLDILLSDQKLRLEEHWFLQSKERKRIHGPLCEDCILST